MTTTRTYASLHIDRAARTVWETNHNGARRTLASIPAALHVDQVRGILREADREHERRKTDALDRSYALPAAGPHAVDRRRERVQRVLAEAAEVQGYAGRGFSARVEVTS